MIHWNSFSAVSIQTHTSHLCGQIVTRITFLVSSMAHYLWAIYCILMHNSDLYIKDKCYIDLVWIVDDSQNQFRCSLLLLLSCFYHLTQNNNASPYPNLCWITLKQWWECNIRYQIFGLKYFLSTFIHLDSHTKSDGRITVMLTFFRLKVVDQWINSNPTPCSRGHTACSDFQKEHCQHQNIFYVFTSILFFPTTESRLGCRPSHHHLHARKGHRLLQAFHEHGHQHPLS